MRFASALLAAAIPLLANGQVQLLPAGEFAARDGRPGKNLKWKVSEERGQRLASELNAIAKLNPVVIDFEHQTMLAGENGKPAPAAGWMTSFEWRNGEGLFAQVDWTDTAKAHIDAKEYRFISPVIDYSKATGEITGLHNAALTNFPALMGMKPVMAQLSAQFSSDDDNDQEPQVDLSALLTQLGLPANTTAEQLSAHLAGLRSTADAVASLRTTLGLAADASLADAGTAIAGLRTKLGLTDAASLADIGTSVATLKSTAGTPDKTTLDAMAALQAKVGELSAREQDREVASLVDAAIADHKVLPATRDFAVNLGKTNIGLLRTYLASAPAVQGLGGQSGGKDPGAGGAAASLTDAGSAVLKNFGISKDQFDAAGKTEA